MLYAVHVSLSSFDADDDTVVVCAAVEMTESEASALHDRLVRHARVVDEANDVLSVSVVPIMPMALSDVMFVLDGAFGE